jgi:hypothetical protein
VSAQAYELEYEAEYEGEAGEFLGAISPALLRRVCSTAALSALQAGMRGIGLVEYEGEFEGESEAERILNPVRRVYPDAMMEHFGHAAAQAQSEAEAEAFIGALIPLAARLIPRVAPAIIRAAPGLIRGVSGIGRTLRASPSTRPLVRTVPTIVRRTAADIARQGARGRPVTPQQAVQTLARQANTVLANPQLTRQALRRAVAADRRYHQVATSCGCLAE